MQLPTVRLPRPNLRGKWNKLSAAMQFLILIMLIGTVGVGVAYAASLTLSDGEWVGLGASAGRLQVEDAATDQILIEDAEFVHNESGGDFDFRVEGDTQNDLLFTDASTDSVGVRTASPNAILHILTSSTSTTPNGAANDFLIENNSGDNGMSFLSADANSDLIYFGSASDAVGAQIGWKYGTSGADKLFTIGTAQSGAEIQFEVANQSDAVRIDSSGNVGIGTSSPGATLDVQGDAIFNESGADNDFRVEGDTINDVLLVDASIDTAEVNGFFSIGADGYFDECCTTITISSNAVTVVDSFHALCAGTGDDDELHTINGNAATGTILVLMSAPACGYTVKDGSGNISLAGDVDFLVEGSGGYDMLMLIKLSTTWIELGRSDN